MATKLLLHLDGNSNDSSGLSQTMTELGIIYYDTGKFGQAYKADHTKSNPFIQGPSFGSIGTGDFTFEFFLKIPQGIGAQYLFCHGTDFSFAATGANGGKRYLQIRSNNFAETLSTDQFDGTFPDDGLWRHIAVVRSSGNLKMYINGSVTQLSNGGIQATYTNALTSSQNFVLGAYKQDSTLYQSGDFLIDEFRISDTAVYTTNFAAPTEAFYVGRQESQVKPLKLVDGELKYIDTAKDEFTIATLTSQKISISSNVVEEKISITAAAGDNLLLNFKDSSNASIFSIDASGQVVASKLVISSTPTSSGDVASKAYVDAALASNVSDVKISFTASGDIHAGAPVFIVSTADETIAEADASEIGTSRIVGIVEENVSGGVTGLVTLAGFADIPVGRIDGGSFTRGEPVYLSENTGKLSSTAPSTAGSRIYQIGLAVSSTKIVIDLKQGIIVT